jgi:hypothetical protein
MIPADKPKWTLPPYPPMLLIVEAVLEAVEGRDDWSAEDKASVLETFRHVRESEKRAQLEYMKNTPEPAIAPRIPDIATLAREPRKSRSARKSRRALSRSPSRNSG